MKFNKLQIAIVSISIFFFVFNPKASAEEKNKLRAAQNGKLVVRNQGEYKSISADGVYGANYSIGAVSDEYRELHDFRLFENGILLFSIREVPGSDVEISNSGNVVFYDHSEHYKSLLKIHFYSKTGEKLFTKEFTGASEFRFSDSGNKFGARNPDGLFVINIQSGQTERYDICYRFDMDETTNSVAAAVENEIRIYQNGVMIRSINTEMQIPRKVDLSQNSEFICVIDKYNLRVFSVKSANLVFSDRLGGNYSFKDIEFIGNELYSGIHKRTKSESSGMMRIYNVREKNFKESLGGKRELTIHEASPKNLKTKTGYKSIPWPFAPFDSMRTVWNHYEQHMGGYGSSYSYLHQGLDLIVPIAEPVYSVYSGVVKCVLTLGGAVYWRMAVSDSQNVGWSNGWLYAHLIENTIQFEVGDTVSVHDYLGDIVEWTSEWGHIHFVEIRDSGLVWFYNDNEWGINFNPLLALTPMIDPHPPIIQNVFDNSLFGFCENETSNYLMQDSLYGNIDIIAKVVDYIGESVWQQPAFRTYYWIKRISDNELIQPRKLGHILNHSYNFYDGDNYEPYAAVMFKRDELLLPSSWSSEQRNYYHVLTNSDGDSIINLSEDDLSFPTTDFADGNYRVYVEVYDPAGNYDLDSMDVKFKNGIVNVSEIETAVPDKFELSQNYPNPFNPSTKIRYRIPFADTHRRASPQNVSLKVYDVLGNEVATLVNEARTPGVYEVNFNASHLSSGMYIYRLRTENFFAARKLLLLK